jgi:hypothetical protein
LKAIWRRSKLIKLELKRDIKMDDSEIQRIMRKYFEKLYYNTLEHLEQTDTYDLA